MGRTYKTGGLASGGGTIAAGTTNTITKYTGGTTLGNSSATDDGTTFSLGTKFAVTEATGVIKTDANVTTAGLGHTILVASPATATPPTSCFPTPPTSAPT